MAGKFNVGIVAKPPLKQLATELRGIDNKYRRELLRLNADLAEKVASSARSKAATGTGQQSAMAPSIKAVRTANAAKMVLASSAEYPFAWGAFFGAAHDIPRRRLTEPKRGRATMLDKAGAKRRTKVAIVAAGGQIKDHITGWNQFPTWVGSNFRWGDRSGGPAAINPAIAEELPQALEAYMHALDELVDRAFSNAA